MIDLPTAPGDSTRTGRGMYIHIPFCIVRCGYCDFNAYAGMDDLMGRYVDALNNEIRSASDGGRVTTIFFGGGTPTQLPPKQLGEILQVAKESFAVDKDAEISIEANPESVSEEVFEGLLKAGFNRVSLGVQSTSAPVLSTLGRVHDVGRAIEAIREARRAGFERVNGDLIFGTPGESMRDWVRSLHEVLEAGVDHLSAYALTIEEGTPLASLVARGSVPAPDEDDQATKYETAHQILIAAGFERYEISNWAKPGSWCRHNVNYWSAGDYLGFGAGAHGHSAGRRYWKVKSPRAYIGHGLQRPIHTAIEEGFEILDWDQRVEEALILGIRLAGGIEIEEFNARYGVDVLSRWAPQLKRLMEEGLIQIVWGRLGRLMLTESGFLFASRVARTFMTREEMLSTQKG